MNTGKDATMTDDPFATLTKSDTTEESSGVAVEEKPMDDASFFAAEMTIGEDDLEQPEERKPDWYNKPEHGAWVPVEIVSSQVGSRDMRVLVGEEGEESVEDTTLDRFELELEHMADCYGQKLFPYLLSVPVWDVKIPFKKPRRKGGKQVLGWEKTSGRKLIAATRVTKPGQAVTTDILPELAEDMHGKIVMAQVRHREKEYTDSKSMKRDDGSVVKCQVDKHGEKVVVREDKEKGLILEDGSPFTGEKSSLIPVDGSYLIEDNSEDGAIVKTFEKKTRIYDNLQDDVAPVPFTVMEKPGKAITSNFTCHKMSSNRVAVERYAHVARTDGSEVDAEVTWNTVGKMTTKPLKAGTEVSAAVVGTGELIRITWLGTEWAEVPEGNGLDQFKGD